MKAPTHFFHRCRRLWEQTTADLGLAITDLELLRLALEHYPAEQAAPSASRLSVAWRLLSIC